MGVIISQLESSLAFVGCVRPQPPYFLRISVDCWENIFDYLSLRDILAMTKTCRRMQDIGGYYFMKNFASIQCEISNEKIYMIGQGDIMPTQNFTRFITHLYLNFRPNRILSTGSFDALKTLYLFKIDLLGDQMDHVKKLLNNIENLTIDGCLNSEYLKHCSNLKYLNVEYECSACLYTFIMYLQKTRRIRHLKVRAHSLIANIELFIASNIQLNYLTVCSSMRDIYASNQFVNQLMTLHKIGFYKTLRLSIVHHDNVLNYQEWINGLASLTAFRGLFLHISINLTRLVYLRELWLCTNHTPSHMQTLAKDLINLERLYFCITTTDHMLPFFQHSKSLKVLRVKDFLGGDLLTGDALDLIVLNAVRAELGTKRRVFVYLNERNYLATKWKTKHLNLPLIVLARGESIDFNLNFM